MLAQWVLGLTVVGLVGLVVLHPQVLADSLTVFTKLVTGGLGAAAH